VEQGYTPGSLVLVRIRVHGRNGAREMQAVLDTGASFVTIPQRDAAELGYDLSRAPQVRLTTANGPVGAPKIILSRLTVGDIEVSDVPALCLDLELAGVSSLLGMSALAHIRIVIDPKQRLISMTRP